MARAATAGGLFPLILTIILIILTILFVFVVATLMAVTGLFIGGYEAVKNYYHSFRKNVRPQALPPPPGS